MKKLFILLVCMLPVLAQAQMETSVAGFIPLSGSGRIAVSYTHLSWHCKYSLLSLLSVRIGCRDRLRMFCLLYTSIMVQAQKMAKKLVYSQGKVYFRGEFK